MNLSKLDTIESYLLVFLATILGFFLFYPDNGAQIGNSALSTRIFTNIVVGGDIINPPIVTPVDEPIRPIVAPIPPIADPIDMPVNPPQVWPEPTNVATNFSTNYPTTNPVTNTNN